MKIHGLWHDANVPIEGNYVDTWAQQNPEAEIKIWTFAEARALIVDARPDLQALYDSLEFIVAQAAFLRFGLVWLLGGIYMDLDVQCLKPFAELGDLPLLVETNGQFVLDAVFGAMPGHLLFTDIFEWRNTHRKPMPTSREAAILWGAIFFTRMVKRFPPAFTPLTSGPSPYVHHHSETRWQGKKFTNGVLKNG